MAPDTHASPGRKPGAGKLAPRKAGPSPAKAQGPGYKATAAAKRGSKPASPAASDGGGSKGEWNNHLAKQDNTSLALRPSGSPTATATGTLTKPSKTVSQPSKEEREKRKAWAEAAAKRHAETLKRMMEAEGETKKAFEARMEERRQAVRARIQAEKEARLALAAKRKEQDLTLSLGRDKDGQKSPARSVAGDDTGVLGDSETKTGPRKRVASPRPLYVRLAEDYERRQAAEEEEIRRKLEQQTAMRQVRVQALMNGEVVIRPVVDDSKAAQPKDEGPKWYPAYRRSESPKPGRSLNHSLRHSPTSSVSGDGLSSRDGSPNRLQRQGNGMVLYSNGDDTSSQAGHALGDAGSTRQRGRLVTRRPVGAAANSGGRHASSHRRSPMVDRACSPIVVDPASQQPLNVPEQEQFWGRSGQSAPVSPIRSGIAGSPAAGALSQAPPPPPSSRKGSHLAPKHGAAAAAAAAGAGAGDSKAGSAAPAQGATADTGSPAAAKPAAAGTAARAFGDDDLAQLGDSFADADPADAAAEATEPRGGGEAAPAGAAAAVEAVRTIPAEPMAA